MAYVAPNLTTFRARFPEFDAVADARIEVVLAEAIGEVGPNWSEQDRAKAQMYLTAHMLVSEGTLMPKLAMVGGVGAINSVSVGDTSVSMKSGANLSASEVEFAGTVYGQRYLALMRRNFPAIAVV